jgi:hypothetical protein
LRFRAERVIVRNGLLTVIHDSVSGSSFSVDVPQIGLKTEILVQFGSAFHKYLNSENVAKFKYPVTTLKNQN